MEPLFSTRGKARLDEIVRPGVLCVFDFDGTLAPITELPDDAHLPPRMLERLLRLSEYAPIAILTGRSVADMRSRLSFTPSYVIGNHGLEGVPGWQLALEKHEACCHAWRAALQPALADTARFGPGVWVEDKRYTLSVHYRGVPDPFSMAQRLQILFDTLSPTPRVVAGKFVFNLLPPNGVDKGRALMQLLHVSRATSAVYVGDDVTDEHVFQLDRRDVLSVRVEYLQDSAAEFFIDTHQDVARFLDELIHRLRLQGMHARHSSSLSQV